MAKYPIKKTVDGMIVGTVFPPFDPISIFCGTLTAHVGRNEKSRAKRVGYGALIYGAANGVRYAADRSMAIAKFTETNLNFDKMDMPQYKVVHTPLKAAAYGVIEGASHGAVSALAIDFVRYLRNKTPLKDDES